MQYEEHIKSLINRYPLLVSIKQTIKDAYYLIEKTYKNNGKLLIAGNGGSAADSEHIVGELMKSFKKPRPLDDEFARSLIEIDSSIGGKLVNSLEKPLAAIPLVTQDVFITAFANDVNADDIFAQQILGYGKPGDLFLAISTSGNSSNIINASVVAKAMGISVLALTGGDGGKLASLADVAVIIPEKETHIIQEYHLPIYHSWCLMLEEKFFGN